MAYELHALPQPQTADGSPRRVGIEVEFGGLREQQVAEIIAQELGGSVVQTSEYDRTVEGTRIGDVEVMLDIFLRDKVEGRIAKLGLDLSRAVVPVEFITKPVRPERIADVDALCERVADAGAFGTQDGIALGFGVHLNVELPDLTVDAVLPTLRAFALIEDWLRDRMQIDTSRRLQPFVDTYGSEFVDALAAPESDGWSMDDLLEAYARLAGSRNHALDVLPILKAHDAETLVERVPAMADKSARPAWHYRLPDCRIAEPGWSVALEWNRWCAVERVAQDTQLVMRLRDAWRTYRNRIIPIPGRWSAVSSEILDAEVSLP